MKTWHVSVGGTEEIPGQSCPTNLSCEEKPWWAHFIETYLMELCCTPIFYWKGQKYTFHDIPLPAWPSWVDEDGDKVNPKEYWGDVGQLWWLAIDPLLRWSFRHTKGWSVPVPWPLLKPHQSAFDIQWVEESLANHAKYKEEEAARDLASKTESNTSPGDNTIQPQVGP